jgi:hypothetical protein
MRIIGKLAMVLFALLVMQGCEQKNDNGAIACFYGKTIYKEGLDLNTNPLNKDEKTLIAISCSTLLRQEAVKHYKEEFRINITEGDIDNWIDYYLKYLQIDDNDKLKEAAKAELEILNIMETTLKDENLGKEKFFANPLICQHMKWEHIKLRLRGCTMEDIKKYRLRLISERPERVFFGYLAEMNLELREIVKKIKGADCLTIEDNMLIKDSNDWMFAPPHVRNDKDLLTWCNMDRKASKYFEQILVQDIRNGSQIKFYASTIKEKVINELLHPFRTISSDLLRPLEDSNLSHISPK